MDIEYWVYTDTGRIVHARKLTPTSWQEVADNLAKLRAQYPNHQVNVYGVNHDVEIVCELKDLGWSR